MMTSHLDNLSEEVLSLCNETSFKYVPEPSNDENLADLLVSLKRFKNSARWKEFWRNKTDSLDNELNSEHETTLAQTGLKTEPKAKNKLKQAPPGSPDLEQFLWNVDWTLLKQNLEMENKPIYKKKDLAIKNIITNSPYPPC